MEQKYLIKLKTVNDSCHKTFNNHIGELKTVHDHITVIVLTPVHLGFSLPAGCPLA